MKVLIKKWVRGLLLWLKWPLTKNLEYDILTKKIMRQILTSEMSCVDVGAHKGEVMAMMQSFAKQGHHFAFEPIPLFFRTLAHQASSHLEVYPFALSNFDGVTSFHLVKDAPAYSGIKRRTYKTQNPEVELIEVQVRCMDQVLAARRHPIGLIKIDVEGGELDVMRGAIEIIKTDRPYLIFECGKGASEFYDNTPEMVHGFLSDLDYRVYSLKAYLDQGAAYDLANFVRTFQEGDEYYFVGVHASKC